MPLFEVVLKVTHECPFGNISRKFTDLKMFVWCNREHEVVEVIVGNEGEYSAVMKQLSKLKGIIKESSNGDKVHLVTKECHCTLENSVGRNIDACNLLHVLPAVYDKGWEYYRIIAFRHSDIGKLLKRLEKMAYSVEIIRKVPFDGFIASSLTLTADTLFSDLTSKQVDALLTAYGYGYYRIPKRADAKTISSEEGVPRTTFQEHLKKAENKLIGSLVPYVQLYKHASNEKRERLRIKVS